MKSGRYNSVCVMYVYIASIIIVLYVLYSIVCVLLVLYVLYSIVCITSIVCVGEEESS